MNYWEAIADNLSKAGWSWGCVATVDSNGQTIFVADALRDNGKRFIVTADERGGNGNEGERFPVAGHSTQSVALGVGRCNAGALS
jgi:hypothetical protein